MKHAHDPVMKAKKVAAMVKASSITIDQAVHVALTSISGTVIDAKLKEKDRRVVWRVKILTPEGRVKVLIDGRSGKLLEAFAETASPNGEEIARPEPLTPTFPSHTESVSL